MNLVITAPSNTTDLRTALSKGEAKVHSEREDGTFRLRHYLTGTALEQALWVQLQRDGQTADGDAPAVTPRSMASIAGELHTSVSAVRRILIDLAITEELDAAEDSELEALFQGMTEAADNDAMVAATN